jgi:hypothetical protein
MSVALLDCKRPATNLRHNPLVSQEPFLFPEWPSSPSPLMATVETPDRPNLNQTPAPEPTETERSPASKLDRRNGSPSLWPEPSPGSQTESAEILTPACCGSDLHPARVVATAQVSFFVLSSFSLFLYVKSKQFQSSNMFYGFDFCSVLNFVQIQNLLSFKFCSNSKFVQFGILFKFEFLFSF